MKKYVLSAAIAATIVGASIFPVHAQQPAPVEKQQINIPKQVAVSTSLIQRLSQKMAQMAQYMGGSAAADTQALMAELSQEIDPQIQKLNPQLTAQGVAAATQTPPAPAKSEAVEKPKVEHPTKK